MKTESNETRMIRKEAQDERKKREGIGKEERGGEDRRKRR